ncbi:MAG: DoxX family membrane protein [Proteobacteria bacterium]|nr:DoxX family membrane protein [Pseudomonadota bacterium]
MSSQFIATMYLICRLIVGGAFVYAGLGKVGMGDADLTAKLAQTIAAYGLLPWWAVNTTAMLLPWIELTAGVLLVFGAFEAPAAMIILLMETVTTIALASALVRGLDIQAGSFSLSSTSSHVSWGLLAFNLILMIMTAFVLRYAYRRDRTRSILRD